MNAFRLSGEMQTGGDVAPIAPLEPLEDMEVLAEAAYQASREHWRKEGVLHDPPRPDVAETLAKAKRPCLKSPEHRN